MNLWQLAWKNIAGNAFRSWVVGICALIVAAFALFATIVLRGAETSLQIASDRLGADIVVVPMGAESKMEGALMMGVPAKFWMPRANVEKIAALPEVESVSAQVYLETLTGASCCSVANMFMIAYDPATDFTLRPWLKQKIGSEGLRAGEVVGGALISATEGGDGLRVYGSLVTLKTNLEATGTGLDQSVFFTLETAQDIARASYAHAEKPLTLPADQVSAVMVKVKRGADPHRVALKILNQVPDVVPIESANLFQSSRKQLTGLMGTTLGMMGLTWALSILLIGLVFSMAANERRRELGVMRAFGANRAYIFKTLLTEAGLLAICGGATGIALAVSLVFLFRQFIMTLFGIPYLLPSVDALLMQIGGGLGLTLLCVGLAALFPAFKTSRLDPAIAMRE